MALQLWQQGFASLLLRPQLDPTGRHMAEGDAIAWAEIIEMNFIQNPSIQYRRNIYRIINNNISEVSAE